jgi:hypothetical protein
LNPVVDPQLESAWFQPATGFAKNAFKWVNLYPYTAVLDELMRQAIRAGAAGGEVLLYTLNPVDP